MDNSFEPNISSTIRYREEDSKFAITKAFHANELSNDVFSLQVLQNRGNNSVSIVINATLKKPIFVELFEVRFRIKKDGKVNCIDRYYTPLTLYNAIWNNDLTPLFIRYAHNNNHYLLTNNGGWFSHQLIDNEDSFDLVIYLDAAALHPAWSHRTQQKLSDATPFLHIGHTYNLSLKLSEVNNTSLPIICRYPYGNEAAFLITDHSDYDDTQSLHKFLEGNNGDGGWLNKGLKLCKGVFTIPSSRQKAVQASTLANDAYLQAVKNLQTDGSEIAPHALNQSGQIDSETFHEALKNISEAFSCTTWIDHGTYLKYCYSVGGAEHPDYRLTDTLSEKGYTALWSYHDTIVDASQSLNMFTAVQENSSARVFKKSLCGQWLSAAHALKTKLERNDSGSRRTAIGLKLISSLRILLSTIAKQPASAVKSFFKNISNSFKYSVYRYLPYTATELLACASVLFTEKKQSLHQWKEGELLLFNTQEVVHTQDCYTEKQLLQLVNEKGLHIGHTYLLNKLAYINGIFTKDGSNLNESWVNFVNSLSVMVKEGRIWNPTIMEFAGYTTSLQFLEINYTSDRSIVIYNRGKQNIKGLSFLITGNIASDNVVWANEKSKYKKTAKGEYIIWGDVPALSSVIVSW